MLSNSVKFRQYRIPRKDSEPLVERLAPSLISAKLLREPGGLQELTIQLMLIWHFSCKANSPAGHPWLSYLMDAGLLSWSGENLLLDPSGYLFGGVLPKARNSPNYFIPLYNYMDFRIIPIHDWRHRRISNPSCAAFIRWCNTLKVLITSGCGFLGSTLALYLCEHGHDEVAMDNLVRRGSESNIERLQEHRIAFVHGDVRCVEDFTGLPPGIELICDASAQPSVVSGYTNPMFDLTNNTLGVIHMLEYARERRCPLIFCSTNRIYSSDRIDALPRREGATRLEWDATLWKKLPAENRPRGFDPEYGVSEEFSLDGAGRSIYGVSELMADVVCQEYADAFDIPVIVNRLGVISGSGQFGKFDQGWVVLWAVACWFGLPLKYIGWGGKQVRDILFVKDVCRLVDLEIGEIGRMRSGVFNARGGAANSFSLLEATQFLEKRLGRSMSISHEENPREADTVIYITDNRKVESVLGWKPRVNLSEGMDSILAWIRQNEAKLSMRYRSAG